MTQDHNHQPLVDHLSRGVAPETQVWVDFRAIHIFQIPEIMGLGIQLKRCSTSTLSFPATTHRRIRDSGPVSSPIEVTARALQGADGPGQLPQRVYYTANVP